MKLIYSLLRFAKKREYLEEMQRGRLRLNTLGFYLTYEGEGAKAIADKDEGLHSIFQPSKVRLYLGGHEISELSGPITIRVDDIANDHLLCMYAIHAGPWADAPIKAVDEFLNYIEINENNKLFGEWVLFTLNAQEFIDRIVNSIKKKDLKATMKPVEYVDEQTYNGSVPKEQLGFVKKSQFSYQNEYRLLVYNHDNTHGPRYIDVGDLSDITQITTFDELKKGIQIEFPEAE